MVKEQISRELKGEAGKLRPMEGLQKTGYDELIEVRDQRVKEIEAYLLKRRKEDPAGYVTRAEIAEKWKIGMRTASRYLADIRKRYKVGVVRTVLVVEAEQKMANLVKLRQLLKEDPQACKVELCKLLEVSRGTLDEYIESPFITDKERALFKDSRKFIRRQTQETRERVKELLAKHKTLSRGEMSRRLGISMHTLSKHLEDIEGW